jgi:hypothetical protein
MGQDAVEGALLEPARLLAQTMPVGLGKISQLRSN